MRVAPRIDPNLAQLERLDLAAHGLAAPFACGGSVAVPGPVALRFRDGARFVADAHESSPFTAADPLAPLLQRCQQAPFGSGRTTRYDRRVRDALQLLAKGGAFTVEGFDPAASGVLEAVRATLAPDDPNALVAELYGVNVYSTGGHFVPHKDTPRGADMLGTLVVCLPVPFSGGELEVTHDGVTKTFAWSNGRRSGPTSGELAWAAFFGDVDHEVKKIWSGHRVTLTWLLRRGAGLPRTVREAPGDPFSEALSAALGDPGFMANGGVIGFRCEHLYAESPGFVRDIPPLDARSVLKLKGRDQQLATTALSAGLGVALKPYVIEPEGQELWRLARFPTPKEAGVFRGRQVTPYKVDNALPVEAHVESYNPDTEVHWVGTPLERERHGTTATKLLGGAEYSTTGYFGNEGGYVEFYLYAALLVTVPSWAQRRPKRATAKARPAATKAARTAKTAPTSVKKSAAAKTTKTKTPSGEFMAAELRAMGHGPAAVRQMLAEGTLERAGFGWYRFVR
jgi:hypothetical protein